MYRNFNSFLTNRTGYPVFAVEYPLCPETYLPDAVSFTTDCYVWLLTCMHVLPEDVIFVGLFRFDLGDAPLFFLHFFFFPYLRTENLSPCFCFSDLLRGLGRWRHGASCHVGDQATHGCWYPSFVCVCVCVCAPKNIYALKSARMKPILHPTLAAPTHFNYPITPKLSPAVTTAKLLSFLYVFLGSLWVQEKRRRFFCTRTLREQCDLARI